MDSRQGHPEPDSESPPVAASSPRSPKLKASSKLNRWSMARALRSGVKVIDRPINAPHRQSTTEESDRKTSVVDGDDVAAGKSIYLVSDGTGWTAEHSVNAALGQFEDRLVNRGCSVNTHLFSWVEDEEKLLEIINQAAKQKAMCFYTLANPSMSKSAKEACDQLGVLSVDILGPIIEGIASHLGVSPSGLTRGAPGRVKTLNDAYFKRIEAIEFTIKQDDGTLPENLGKADIILVGVSRTGKTPLSTYIAQKGYKVANVPFVMGVEPPKTLFEVEPRKVFALTIQLVVLQAIRRTRAKTLGVDTEGENRYSGFDLVRKELDFASKIYAKNPGWAVIDVTNKAIEDGKWTVQQAAELSVAAPTIAASLDCRYLSGLKDERENAAKVLEEAGLKEDIGSASRGIDKKRLIDDVRQALYASKICSYAQGMNLLRAKSVEKEWNLNLGEMARIWKGGCIIRAVFLDRIKKAYQRNPNLASLVVDPDFAKEMVQRQAAWRRVVGLAISAGISTPGMCASLAYFDTYRRARLPANLVQAQRDLFGAHTYERTDRPGAYHTEWTKLARKGN